MPRDVPAFDRSPAPRAPKPRMTSRTSLVPYRLCANTPGTERSTSSSEYPLRFSSSFLPTRVTASGTVISASFCRVAVIVTGAIRRAESAEDVGGSCATAAQGATQQSTNSRRGHATELTVTPQSFPPQSFQRLAMSLHFLDHHPALRELRDVFLGRDRFVGSEHAGLSDFSTSLHLAGDR
jgi:hypothetical protein